MKRCLLLLLLLLPAVITRAQDIICNQRLDSFVCIFPPTPEFPGGNNAFRTFIKDNLVLPPLQDIEGRIIVRFKVYPDGSTDSLRIIRGLGFACDQAVLSVLRMMPCWIPGKGQNETVIYSMPIDIRPE